MKKKESGYTRGRSGDAANVRPWTAGLEADHPGCRKCTWVYAGGKFKLKFVNRACRLHRKLV